MQWHYDAAEETIDMLVFTQIILSSTVTLKANIIKSEPKLLDSSQIYA